MEQPDSRDRRTASPWADDVRAFSYRILDDTPDASDDLTTLLRHVLRVSRVGFWSWDAAARVLTVSQELLTLYGASATVLDAGPRALDEFVHPDDRGSLGSAIDGLIHRGETMEMKYRVLRGVTDECVWFTARGVCEPAHPSVFTCAVIETDDLGTAESQLREAHLELLEAHQRQLAVIATTPDAIHIYDVTTNGLQRAHAEGAPLTGFSAEAIEVLHGENLVDLVPRGDLNRLQDTLFQARSLRDSEVIGLRHRVMAKDGGVSWLSRRVSPLSRHPDGTVRELVVVSRDATGEVTATERLRHAATHDELTGLSNRRFFMQTLAERLASLDDSRTHAVLLCDLDGFKQINDSHGHAAGDEVLRQVAARLKHATREDDVIGRLGGDEFVLLLVVPSDVSLDSVADTVARRIVSSLSQPIRHKDFLLAVNVSVGIATAAPGTDAEAVVAAADEAMYRAKQVGGNRHGSSVGTGRS